MSEDASNARLNEWPEPVEIEQAVLAAIEAFGAMRFCDAFFAVGKAGCAEEAIAA